MRTRWPAYAAVSAALAGGVIIKALAQRPNFYSAAVYLAQSSANLMILTNFVFVTACSILYGLQKLLYGPLRPIEIEQLYEKAWFAVTETCLAMTIFRGEIGAWFLVMFFALLAGKVWAWIGEGRIEILEQQPPRNPRLFHTRLALSLGLSVLFDLSMLEYVVKQVMHMARPDMMVMFGFEFAVLSIVSLSTAARYAINLAEIAIVRQQKARRVDEIRRERIATAVREVEQNAQQASEQEALTDTSSTATSSSSVPFRALEAARRALQQPIDDQEVEVEGWEDKGRWIFYLDLATDFFKLVVYLSFFFILLIFYGLPIHILRDVFMTFRSFFKRIGDFMRYRTATRDMNARYPDATEQDIGSEDVCIICREEMRPYQPPANGERPNPVAERMRPKKLPCGHILHFSCLRSWLERQQICPTCRTNVVTRNPARTGQNNAPAADAAAGQHGNQRQPERQGPRIYQWGPLRIGIGAARGNVLEDLQQQLGDGQNRQGQQAQGDGPQQYGFGIRWDGLRRRDRGDRGDRGTRSISRQLDEIQRQISQEYRALGQMTQEYRQLRNMEEELTRIRAQRQGNPTTAPTVPARHTNANLPTVTALTGNLQNVVPAGSDRLPAGLTLPEGWSILPLHPTQVGVPSVIGQTVVGAGAPQASTGAPVVPLMNSVLPNSGEVENVTHPPSLQFQQLNQNGQPSNETVSNTASAVQLQQPLSSQHGLNLMNQTQQSSTIPNHEATTRPHNEATNDQNNQNGTNAVPSIARSVPSTDPPPFQSYQHVNGLGSQEANTSTFAQPRPNGGDEGAGDYPVASMFTLPTWGSTAMAPSTSRRGRNPANEEPTFEQAQSNDALTSDSSRPISRQQVNGPSISGQGNKNPTVEDLVEAPD